MFNESHKVKDANKMFYDTVGSAFEDLDGRRSESLQRYCRYQLQILSEITDGKSLLDCGCGSGFIANIATNFFQNRFALDLSFEMAKSISEENIVKITGDSDFLPLKTSTMSVVVTFAMLHHCYSFERIFKEIYAILKKGGVYYSDHDLEASFFRRFRPLIHMYRKHNDSWNRYFSRFKELNKDIYDYTEYHQQGLDSVHIERVLKDCGFREISLCYHWFGLSSLTNLVFGYRSSKRGMAPLLRIIAIK